MMENNLQENDLYTGPKISYFYNYKSTDSTDYPLFYVLLNQYTLSTTKKAYEMVQKGLTKQEYDDLKADQNCITVSGHFRKRNIKGLIKHSGYICIDIDGKDNPQIEDFRKLRDAVSWIENVAYCSLSLSQKGIFCIIPIKYPEKHKEHFYALREDFSSMGITIDKQCGDITRLRILAYDPEVYINRNALVYQKTIEKRTNKGNSNKKEISHDANLVRQPSNKQDERKKVEIVLKKIEAKKLDICPSYNEWFSLANAFINTFGEDGRVFFHRVSIFNDSYNKDKSDILYSKLLDNYEYNKYSLGTFFYLAKQALNAK